MVTLLFNSDPEGQFGYVFSLKQKRFLFQDEGKKIVIDEQRLILKAVDKKSSGLYVCSASNVEGDGFSKPMNLDVKYKPR